jgi:hypothetical protein
VLIGFLLCLLGVDGKRAGFPCDGTFRALGRDITQVVEIYHTVDKHTRLPHGDRARERTQDFTVHHHLPRIDRQVRIVEAPVKLLRRRGFVRRVVVRREVFMGETVGRVDTCSRVKDEHLFEQVEGCVGKAKSVDGMGQVCVEHTKRVGARELLAEWHSFSLRQTLHESEGLESDSRVSCGSLLLENGTHVFTGNGLDHIIRWCAQQFSDDRELVDV